MMNNSWMQWVIGDRVTELSAPHFQFNVPFGTVSAFCLILAAGFLTAWYSWAKLGKLSGGTRALLCVLRALAVLLAFSLAFDPSVVGTLIHPGDHYLLMLFDDSNSMNVVEPHGKTRAERLIASYPAEENHLAEELQNKYQLVHYRFGERLERIQSVDHLEFQQNKSDPLAAVHGALFDMEGLQISGIVLFSDGRRNTGHAPESIENMIPSDIPVFPVYTGVDEDWRDLRIEHLSFRQTHFDKSPVVFNAEIASEGLAGKEAVVEIMEGGKAVASETFDIDDNRQIHQVRLEFIPSKKDWIAYQARVRLKGTALGAIVSSLDDKPSGGSIDRVPQNNEQSFLVDNRKKTYRILYFSGRPNWENKFYRRALEDDEELRLTGLIRISSAERKFVYRGAKTAMTNPLFEGYNNEDSEKWGRYDESVFLRLGASESDLVKGYPSDAEELFQYDLIIWGDIERNYFSIGQLELTRDFVDKRGGSLLLLGGDRSFTEGHFNNTVIENMLPVLLYGPNQPQSMYQKDDTWKAHPTMEGMLSGAFSLDTDSKVNQELWNEMPPLFGFNDFALTRAGADIFAYYQKPVSHEDRPLFVLQRYGNGRCAVLATAETWEWQMKAPLDDQRHERLWRQITRYLVHGVPNKAELRNKEDVYRIGNTYNLEFHLRDKNFDERTGLQTRVTLAPPNQPPIDMSVDESIEENGIYRAEFQPQETGLHTISLKAVDDSGETVGELEDAILAQPNMDEFQNAQGDPEFLRAIAEHSGGRFLTLDELPSLPQYVPWIAGDDTETLRIHLWHMPGLYFLLLILFSLEWFLRRKKGQA